MINPPSAAVRSQFQRYYILYIFSLDKYGGTADMRKTYGSTAR